MQNSCHIIRRHTLKDPIFIYKNTLNVTIVYSKNSIFRVLPLLALFRGHSSINKLNIDFWRMKIGKSNIILVNTSKLMFVNMNVYVKATYCHFYLLNVNKHKKCCRARCPPPPHGYTSAWVNLNLYKL